MVDEPFKAPERRSEYRQALDRLAGEKVRIDQAIADNASRGRAGLPVADSTAAVLEGITSLIGNIIHALQVEATTKESQS